MLKCILPDVEDGENWVKTEILEEEYTNFAFLLNPEQHYKDAHKRILKH